MYIFLLILLLFFCFILFCVVSSKFKLSKYGMLGVAVICGALFLMGAEIINVTVLPEDIQSKVNQVAETCGDTYVRVDGNEVEVYINEEWVNLEEVSIIGGVLSDEIILEYDGKEIYLGESGVVNTIKALEAVGLIKSK